MVRQFLIKFIHLFYNPAIPLSDIYPRKVKAYVHKETCSQTFRAAPFVIVKVETIGMFITRKTDRL